MAAHAGGYPRTILSSRPGLGGVQFFSDAPADAFAGGPGESSLALGPAELRFPKVERRARSKEEMEAMTAATTSGMRWEQGPAVL